MVYNCSIFLIFTDYSQDTSELKVLCQNGSLANNAGLDVDTNCALGVFISSEISTRAQAEKFDKKTSDIKLLLQEYQRWYEMDGTEIPFEVFSDLIESKELVFKVKQELCLESVTNLKIERQLNNIKKSKKSQ